MSRSKFLFVGSMLFLSIAQIGCGKNPEAAKADAMMLMSASDSSVKGPSLRDPEVIRSGRIVQCRDTKMAHMYYCAWQIDLDNGKSIGTATLSPEYMEPGTPVNEMRMFYRSGDGDDDWAYEFFLRPVPK